MINWKDYIHSDIDVLAGKPVIKGTRISIALLLELLSEGWSHQMIIESYPNLNNEHLQAVYAYLKDCMEQELYFPISKSA